MRITGLGNIENSVLSFVLFSTFFDDSISKSALDYPFACWYGFLS